MDALAAVLIILVVLVLLALIVFAVLKTRSRAPTPPTAHTHASNVPGYTHDPRHMEYYRPQISRQDDARPKPEPPRPNDPRKEPLPRCPSCGAAIGYDDERCYKCGLVLKENP